MSGLFSRFITIFIFLFLIFNSLANASEKIENNSGVKGHFDYIADGWYGLQGGFKNDSAYLGRANLAVDLDLEKLINWKGYTALVNIQNINGDTPNLKVNSLQGFDNIEYDPKSNMTYLFQLWLQKQFNDKWSVLFGYYDTNTEFYLTDSSLMLIQSTYGMGTSLAQIAPRGPSTFPIDGIALRIKFTPTIHHYLQVALLDASMGNPLNPAYSRRPFSSGDGVLGIGELGYLFLDNEGKNSVGKIAVGVWAQGVKTDKLAPEEEEIVEEGEEPVMSEPGKAYNKGLYVLLDHPLYISRVNSTRVLHGFLRYGNAVSSVNLFDHSVGTGLFLTAPFNREEDSISLGFAPAWTSKEAREADPELPLLEFQNELTYAAVINKWITLQPDVQYIVFKNGNHEIYKNAFLVGLRGILTVE